MTDAHTDNRRLRAEAMRLREKVDRLEAELIRLTVINGALRLACQTLEQARRDAA